MERNKGKEKDRKKIEKRKKIDREMDILKEVEKERLRKRYKDVDGERDGEKQR
jgi:hypothetical protein